ncbi:MAG: hypothetical protein V3S02_01180 [Dehalococcoidales bacterium]
MSGRVELDVLNPRGVIEPLPTYAPNKRITDLAGKVVGFYSNEKDGMENFYTVFSELLKKKYPTARTTFLAGDYTINDKNAQEWVPQLDAFVYGVGD